MQRKLRHWCRGESSAWRCTDKGGYSLSRKRVSPLNPREKGRGVLPLDPAYIGSLWLEELRGLRNRVRCTWLRHESLHFVTIRNRALLRGARVTVVRRRTACGAALLRSPRVGLLLFYFNSVLFCERSAAYRNTHRTAARFGINKADKNKARTVA